MQAAQRPVCISVGLNNDRLCIIVSNFNKQFKITSHASNFEIEPYLVKIKKVLSIAYALQTLNEDKINYSTTAKGLLSIAWTVKDFRSSVYGNKFRIITDHKPLTLLMKLKDQFFF